MDLNAAAVIFMGGYVVLIVVAGLVMSLRPGGVTVPFLATAVGGAGRTGHREAILLGGEAEVLGNFRGHVQAVLLGARTGRLEEVTLASGGGLIEGGRVPAGAIVSADGRVLQLAEPWVEPDSDSEARALTLQKDVGLVSREGKRLGKLKMVCFDRDSGMATGLVVLGGGRSVLVPIGRVKAAGPDRITTDLTGEEWRGLGVFAGDDEIKAAILDRLASDPVTQPFVRSLNVDVQDQRVRLRGYVRTQAQADHAAALARAVPGVPAVELAIHSDEGLARAVKEAIGGALGASAANLEVRSEFGQVDVVGEVPDRQALQRIDAIGSQVPGVSVFHNLATAA